MKKGLGEGVEGMRCMGHKGRGWISRMQVLQSGRCYNLTVKHPPHFELILGRDLGDGRSKHDIRPDLIQGHVSV